MPRPDDRELKGAPRLLILAPSVGFGGGIERVAVAIEQCWPGLCFRVDLYRSGHIAVAGANTRAKLGFALRCLRQASRARPRTVLALHIGLLPVAYAISRITRSDLVLLGIGTEVWQPLSRGTRLAVRGCDRLLAISHFTAQHLARRAVVACESIVVVPLPVDEAILAVAKEVNHRQPRQPLLLTVSRIVSEHRYKGHFAIAASLPRVLSQHPSARWIVVGEGDDVPHLQARCRELGIQDAVLFEGRVSDARLVELYRQASAMVLPSVADAESDPPTGEGFGLVYAEAAAFGVPVIASTQGGGAAELVIDRGDGLAVAPGDIHALASAILELLTNDGLRRRLGDAAQRRVFAHHTPSRFREALLEGMCS